MPTNPDQPEWSESLEEHQCDIFESIYYVLANMLEELKRINQALEAHVTGVFKLKMDWLSRPEVGESVCFGADGKVYSSRYAGPDEKGKGIVLAVHEEDCTCDVLLNDNPPGGGSKPVPK